MCQSAVPAESIVTLSLNPACSTYCRNTPSAVGERQILPKQTNKIFIMTPQKNVAHAVSLPTYRRLPAEPQQHPQHEYARHSIVHAAAQETPSTLKHKLPKQQNQLKNLLDKHKYQYDDGSGRPQASHFDFWQRHLVAKAKGRD